jgi:lipoyl(octanoyl) transferase
MRLIKYEDAMQIMDRYVHRMAEDKSLVDYIWPVEHYPIYTYGRGTSPESIPKNLEYDIVSTSRGGKMTFHAPGQVIVYIMVRLSDSISIRDIRMLLEDSCITILRKYGLEGTRNNSEIGLWIKSKKIFSLGLRVKRNIIFHGCALNVSMDLKPFDYISPCGLECEMTSIIAEGIKTNKSEVSKLLFNEISNRINLLK